MYEANRMAEVLAELLNEHGVRDGGAQYRFVVTDTAGNVAEVTYSERPAGGWPCSAVLESGWGVSEEEFDRKKFAERTRSPVSEIAEEVERVGGELESMRPQAFDAKMFASAAGDLLGLARRLRESIA